MDANPNNERRIWLTAYAPLAFWTVLVITLGSNVGSMSETSGLIRPILVFLFPSAGPDTLTLYHGYVRKFAHFAEYAVLAFLALRAVARARFRYIAAFAFTLLIAVVDEGGQSLNPSRTSSPWDVVLDLAGGSAALLVYWLLLGRRSAGGR